MFLLSPLVRSFVNKVTTSCIVSRTVQRLQGRYLCSKMASDTNAHKYQAHPLIVWVDCEMTGLEIAVDQLLEVAVIITDSDLNEVDVLEPIHISTEKAVLDTMNDWCKKNHKKSGLTDLCLKSKTSIQEADDMLFDLLNKHNIKRAALGGNSVSYDRIFLAKFCPKFSSLLHYRNIDVSSFKEIVKRWYPDEAAFRKKLVHRALEDIRESIDEMKFYRKMYFKDPQEVKMSSNDDAKSGDNN